MPSLVGDCGQVLRELSWALTIEYVIYYWYYTRAAKGAEWWLCVEHSSELFIDIRGGGGASNACFYSLMSPSCRQAVNFSKCAFILVKSKLSVPRVVTNMSLA